MSADHWGGLGQVKPGPSRRKGILLLLRPFDFS